jgi:hypothetical protein
MNYKQEARKQIELEQKILNSRTRLIELLPDDIPHVFDITFNNVCHRIDIPYSTPIIAEVKEFMLDAGWDCVFSEVWTHCGDFVMTFEKDGLHLLIHAVPNVEGSVCVKKIIGTTEQPIYEIVCKDAANE